MSRGKAIGLSLLFGLLSVIIVAASAIISVIMVFLTPMALVFTGLWAIWFINQDYDDCDSGKDESE